MAEQLSEHFTLEELIHSDTAKARGIDNTPTDLHKKVLKHTCEYLLEPLRKNLNGKYKLYKGKKVKHVQLRITSAYRCEKLNIAVGGSPTSKHKIGECVDCEAVIVYTNNVKVVLPYTQLYEDVKQWVKEGSISVDQCIQECAGDVKWVHLGHSNAGRTRDRKQFMKYNNGTYVLDCVLK